MSLTFLFAYFIMREHDYIPGSYGQWTWHLLWQLCCMALLHASCASSWFSSLPALPPLIFCLVLSLSWHLITPPCFLQWGAWSTCSRAQVPLGVGVRGGEEEPSAQRCVASVNRKVMRLL
jgi:hypothetical protein